jgi:hypothetical protein
LQRSVPLQTLDKKESTIIYRHCTRHCGLQSCQQRTGVANSSTAPVDKENRRLTTSFKTALCLKSRANSPGRRIRAWKLLCPGHCGCEATCNELEWQTLPLPLWTRRTSALPHPSRLPSVWSPEPTVLAGGSEHGNYSAQDIVGAKPPATNWSGKLFHCPCGQGEQAPYHILQDCPLFEVQSQQSWPGHRLKCGGQAELRAASNELEWQTLPLPLWTRRTGTLPHPSRLPSVWSPEPTDLTWTPTKMWGDRLNLGLPATNWSGKLFHCPYGQEEQTPYHILQVQSQQTRPGHWLTCEGQAERQTSKSLTPACLIYRTLCIGRSRILLNQLGLWKYYSGTSLSGHLCQEDTNRLFIQPL